MYVTEHPAHGPEPPGRLRRHLAAALAVVLLGLGGGLAGQELGITSSGTSTTGVTTTTTTARTVATTGTSTIDVAAVLAKVKDSVVLVEARDAAGTMVGTGVVVTSDGEILTNAHVVEGAIGVTVTLSGESAARTATVVASDTARDLALLRVAGVGNLESVSFSTNAAVGDDVIAIGEALGLDGEPSVTRGIVSALDRTIDTDEGTMTGLVQTDAAVSSGNSGGPLVNSSGKVIGITSLIATSTEDAEANDVAFAIPAGQVLDFLAQFGVSV